MKEQKKPCPVILTGRVYVHGALEEEFPSQRCPAKPEAGTLRIHSHLDQQGRDRRARGFASAGYSGVIRASLFDGKSWRKFMLARETQVEERSFSQFSHRPEKARAVLRTLGRLKGKTCIYREGAFAVDHELASVLSTTVDDQPPASAAAVITQTSSPPPASSCAPTQGTLFPVEAAAKPHPKTSRQRKPGLRKRSKATNKHQPLLF